MKKLYELETTYTKKDHLLLNYTLLLKSLSFKLIIIFLISFIPQIITKQYEIIISEIFFILIFLLFPLIISSIAYNSNKSVQNKKIIVEFYKDYILQKTDISSYKAEHKNIYKIISNKNYYYILMSKNQAIIIPKNKLTKEMEQYVNNIKY